MKISSGTNRARLLRAANLVLGAALLSYVAALALNGPAQPNDGHRGIAWERVSRADLITAALYLDVQEGGPTLALAHLDRLVARDTTLRISRHSYAHAVGRYAVQRDWDPRVFAACTPRFESGCYHGVIESYVTHLPRLSLDQLASLCDSISGASLSGVPRRECAHGLGHGLWFRAREQALGFCDGLSTPVLQEECRDGMFMQRANERMALRGAPTEHHHHADDANGHGSVRQNQTGSAAFACQDEAPQYRHACWHYQGRLLLLDVAQDYSRAFERCDAAAEPYNTVCYWGLGKWIAAHAALGTNATGQILERCGSGRAAFRGACVAGAVESLIDEDWTLEGAAQLCRAAPADTKLACYAKLGERIGILYAAAGEIRACALWAPADFTSICRTAAIHERSRDVSAPPRAAVLLR